MKIKQEDLPPTRQTHPTNSKTNQIPGKLFRERISFPCCCVPCTTTIKVITLLFPPINRNFPENSSNIHIYCYFPEIYSYLDFPDYNSNPWHNLGFANSPLDVLRNSNVLFPFILLSIFHYRSIYPPTIVWSWYTDLFRCEEIQFWPKR